MSAGIRFLLDTNVISELQKRQPNPLVLSFLKSVPGSRLFLSVLTLGELRKGAFVKRDSDPAMYNHYSTWIDTLQHIYSDRVLDVDTATATLWGELSAGRSRPVVDTLLAATAIAHDLTLTTRNTADFTGLSVKLLNPWQV